MKTQSFALVRYDADEGKVFDWATPRYRQELIDPEKPDLGYREVQEHLYAKTIFVGGTDTIDNYIEVDEPKEEEE